MDTRTGRLKYYQQQICFQNQQFNMAAAVLRHGDTTGIRAVFSTLQPILQDGPVLVEGNCPFDTDLTVLPHGLTLSDTQFIPYYNYHWARPVSQTCGLQISDKRLPKTKEWGQRGSRGIEK
jgi:hypothetical protein